MIINFLISNFPTEYLPLDEVQSLQRGLKEAIAERKQTEIAVAELSNKYQHLQQRLRILEQNNASLTEQIAQAKQRKQHQSMKVCVDVISLW